MQAITSGIELVRVNEAPEGEIVGASILCFAMVGSDVYFLLGKEQENMRWKMASNRWSDFGGRVNGDERPERTAAREFLEETMAIVKFNEWDFIPRLTSEDIEKGLESGDYCLRITINLPVFKNPMVHVCYLKRIPWDPGLPNRFRFVRNRLRPLLDLDKICDGLEAKITSETLREMEKLIHADVGYDLTAVDCWYQKSSVPSQPDFLEVHYHGKNSIRRVIPLRQDLIPFAETFAAIVRHRATQITLYKDLPHSLKYHPAICIQRWRTHMTRVHVDHTYLEKQSVRWWSIPRILELMENTCTMKDKTKDVARLCFIPTMTVILQQLDQMLGQLTDAKSPREKPLQGNP